MNLKNKLLTLEDEVRFKPEIAKKLALLSFIAYSDCTLKDPQKIKKKYQKL
jgi:hypothetical protein